MRRPPRTLLALLYSTIRHPALMRRIYNAHPGLLGA